MKILVPTDFSSHAEFAFEAALKIAKKVGGEIHVFHAANVPGSWKAFAIDENISHSMSDSIKKYANYNLKVLNNNAIQNNVACSSHFCEEGFR